LGELTGVGDDDVVLADAKLPAAERADRHRDAAREAGRARRFRNAIAVAVVLALGGAKAAVPRREHAALRQLAAERNAEARSPDAVARRRRDDDLGGGRHLRSEIANATDGVTRARSEREPHEEGITQSNHRVR